MRPVFLHDRDPKVVLKERHPKVHACLAAKGILEGKNERVRFVGIVSPDPDTCVVFLPHGAPRDLAGEGDRFARNVMAALARFSREYSRTGEEEAPEPALSFVALLAAIAEDFRDHGIFAERLREGALNSGKPDWPATVRRQIPMIAASGAPVYADVRTVRPFVSSDNALAIIQAALVREIHARHGWWLEDSFGKRPMPDAAELPRWPRESWGRVLRGFRQKLFAERPLRLLDLLLAYLEQAPRGGEGGLACGVSDFSTVWEVMLRQVLPGVEEGWNARLPGPWYLDRNGSPQPSGRMEMDIVVRNGERLVIVDAKYYRAVSAATAPGWADIVKQLYYAEALATVAGAPDAGMIGNCFMFPVVDGEAGELGSVAMFDNAGMQVGRFPEVRCVYVGMNTVLSGYSHRHRLASPLL